MSDTQDDRPADNTAPADAPAAPPVPTQSAAEAAEAGTAATAATAAQETVPSAPAEPGAPAQPAASAEPSAWQAPGQSNPQAQGPQIQASQAPASAAQQSASPAQPPYQPYGHAYGAPRPQAFAGQQPGPHPYAGQPAPQPYGSAFGAPVSHTQPTQPIGASAGRQTGTVPVAPAEPKKKSGAGKGVGLIVAAALVAGAAGLGGVYVGANLFAPASSSPAAGPGTVTINNSDSVNQTAAIAAKTLPSVVTIAASSNASNTAGGSGSGVVLTEDGYVVTNTHVVTLDGATGDAALRVTTSDGRVYDAEIVGTDPVYDLAVIKLVDAEGLTPIEFADSAQLNVGDQTVAVGSPLGLSNTVTTGIVSALNRSIQVASAAAPEESDEDAELPDEEVPFFFDFGPGTTPRASAEPISIAVIQTDAAINPGNSGGALVEAEGRLIGINVAIATAGGMSGQAGSIGVGFAIPSDIVQRVSDELIENGVATHGLLGAVVASAAYVEGTSITGAYIREATGGGAAAVAGLRAGDIVTAFNGIPITDSVDLTAQVRAVAAGSTATVTYVRDGETHEVEVTLGELGG